MKRKTTEDKSQKKNSKIQKKHISMVETLPFTLEFFTEEEIFNNLSLVSKIWKKTCYQSLTKITFSECDYQTVKNMTKK